MATDEIDKLFQEADAAVGADASPPAETNGIKPANPQGIGADGIRPPTDLAAKVAEKRKGAAGKQEMIQGKGITQAIVDDPTAPAPGDSALSPQARDELAKMAARNGGDTSVSQTAPTTTKASGKSRQSAPSGGATKDATASESPSSSSGIPDEIPGLTTTVSSPAEGDPQAPNAFEKRKAELDAARTKGKTPKKTAAQLRKEAAAKAKEKADREKAKAKEKTQKQKDKEKERADKAKAATAEKKKKEDERKAKLAAERKARADARAAKATPDLLAKMPAEVKRLFAEHYRLAGPKTDKNPDGLGTRRAKADRGDFCAGWVTLLRAFQKEGKGQIVAPAAKA